MRKTAVTFEAVRALGRAFPYLHESTMYGSPALKLGKRLVACLAIRRSAEPGSLVVRTDFEQRAALLGDDPETYYVTDHYAPHPVVLVRLARVQHDQLRDLLAAARQCVLAHAERSRKKTRLQEYRSHGQDDKQRIAFVERFVRLIGKPDTETSQTLAPYRK